MLLIDIFNIFISQPPLLILAVWTFLSYIYSFFILKKDLNETIFDTLIENYDEKATSVEVVKSTNKERYSCDNACYLMSAFRLMKVSIIFSLTLITFFALVWIISHLAVLKDGISLDSMETPISYISYILLSIYAVIVVVKLSNHCNTVFKDNKYMLILGAR